MKIITSHNDQHLTFEDGVVEGISAMRYLRYKVLAGELATSDFEDMLMSDDLFKMYQSVEEMMHSVSVGDIVRGIGDNCKYSGPVITVQPLACTVLCSNGEIRQFDPSDVVKTGEVAQDLLEVMNKYLQERRKDGGTEELTCDDERGEEV